MNAKSLFSVLVIVIGCGKMTKKQILHPELLYVKSLFCIENAKFEKIKTWPWSKIIKDEGHVLGNANFSPRRQINDFTYIRSFFLRLKMTMFPLRLTAITSIKNHSKGIYEERWHVYDLRKESCADGGLGRPILGKTCYFLGLSSKNQNHFVNLILGCFSPFQVSKWAL